MKSVLRPNSIKIFELLFSAIAIQLFVVYFLISEAISETEPKILIIPGLILFTTIRVSRYKGEVARGITVLYSLIFAFMFFFLSYQVGIRDFLETDVDDYFSITIPFLFSAVGMYFAFTKESTEWIYDKDNEEGDIPNEENLDSDQLDLEKSSTERPIIPIVILGLFALWYTFFYKTPSVNKSPPIKEEVIDINSDDFINLDCGKGTFRPFRFKINSEKEIVRFFSYYAEEWVKPNSSWFSIQFETINIDLPSFVYGLESVREEIDIDRITLDAELTTSYYNIWDESESEPYTAEKKCKIISKDEMNTWVAQTIIEKQRKDRQREKEAEEIKKNREKARKL